MKHSIHLAAIALLTTLLVTSCDTFSAPADPDKNTEQVLSLIHISADCRVHIVPYPPIPFLSFHGSLLRKFPV